MRTVASRRFVAEHQYIITAHIAYRLFYSRAYDREVDAAGKLGTCLCGEGETVPRDDFGPFQSKHVLVGRGIHAVTTSAVAAKDS